MRNNFGPGIFGSSALRLFAQLLVTMAVVEAAIMWLLPDLPFGDGARIFIDAGLLATVSAPLIWLLVGKPLRRAAQESEGKFRALVEQSLVGISVFADGKFLYVNPKHEEIFGYTADEMLTMNPKDLAAPEDRRTVLENMRKRFQGEVDSISYSFRGLRKDGKVIDVAVNGKRTTLNGRPVIVGVLLDVTAQRRAGEALERERDFISAVLDTAGALVVVLDRDGLVMRFNRQCEKVTGYRCAEIVGKPVWERLLIPEDLQPVKAVFEHLMAGDFPREFENWWVAKNGERRMIAWSNTVLLDEAGNVEFVVATGIDVTERRLMEMALRESEAKLRQITSELGDGIYVLDRAGMLTFMNAAAEQMLGWGEAELLGKNAHETFHFQKPDGTHVPLCDCPVYQSIHSGETYRIHEDYFTRKDGTLFPVSFVATPLHRGGEIVGSVAAFQDVTSRLEGEKALHESEEKFRLISTSAMDAIVIIDPEEEITYWNPAAESIFGYETDEVLGRNLHELLAPSRYHEESRRGFGRFRESGEGVLIGKTLEITALRKGGEEFPIELSISCFQIGGQRRAMGIVRDISDRKKAEEEIHHLAYYDTLTDLPNRRLLFDRLNQALAQAERHKRPLAVLFLDLDHFKKINDTLGHDIGDELLKVVATRLNACVRSADTLSRQGGDEFVIVLAELTQPQDATLVADKILKILSEPISVRDHQLHVTTSIGISIYTAGAAEGAEELMKKADLAMYAAKEGGRNKYSICYCPAGYSGTRCCADGDPPSMA